MPKGGKVKIKKALPKGTSAEDVNSLNSMFDQLTGVQEADPDIIRPKLIKLKNNIELEVSRHYIGAFRKYLGM